jgi:hypothetical protein
MRIAGGTKRHIAVVEPAKEVAGSRHVWRLKINWIGQWKRVMIKCLDVLLTQIN